ncbi:hypothetical protein RJ639_022551, partial [Escallonia herrerae]
DGAALSLRRRVEEEARDLSGEAFSRFMDLLYDRITTLLESSDVAENLGALRAIDELVDLTLGESASKFSRFSNYIRTVFEAKRDPEILILASKVLGRLARAGGAMIADEVERQVKSALEWLCGERVEYRRFAAVLILKETAENASTVFNVHVSEFVDAIWFALRDPTLAIRERAVEALRACLRVIEKRETRWRVQWYYRMFEATQEGLGRNAPVHSIHGSLLAVGELLRNTGEFMMSRYREVAEIVLRYLEHRDRLVRLSITSLLPRIAHFLRDRFVTSYLTICMNHILAVLKIPAERASGFIALGEMAGALDGELVHYLPTIMSHLRDAIAPRRGKQSLEALACVGNIAKSMGPAMEPHGHDLLEFARESVVVYLEDEDGATRKDAALCCCKLAANSLSGMMCSQFSASRSSRARGKRRRLVEEIVEKLLIAAVADADVNVRHSIFSSLHGNGGFDDFLAQADSLTAIFAAFNDEDFEVREYAISVAGRLSEKNPAYVLPALRRHLIQLLTYLRQSADSKCREESAKLLGCLIRNCERLILPYIAPIHKALLEKLSEGTGVNANNGIISGVLVTVGDLARVGGFAMRQYISDLMRLIVEALLDGAAATKREVAVATLGQVLGIIGALDPHVHKRNQQSLPGSHGEVIRAASDTGQQIRSMDELPTDLWPSFATSEDYFSTVLPDLFHIVCTCEDGLKEFITWKLGTLVSIVRQHIRKYLPELLSLVSELWSSFSLPATNRPVHGSPVTGHISALVHHLKLVLDGNNDELQKDAVDALCSLAHALGEDFTIFIPSIHKLLLKHRLRHKEFEEIEGRLQRREPLILGTTTAQRLSQRLPVEVISDPLSDVENDPYEDGIDAHRQSRSHQVNEGRLRTAGEASQRSTKEDWAEWMRHFSIELLKESPSPALRTCARLAQLQYADLELLQPFVGRELFAAGFVSCWSQLNETSQRQLIRSLEMAFSSPNIPPEILATLLNLAEFMEHDERPLPIDIRLLGALAEKCRAFAKALHYKEMEFEGARSNKTDANPVAVVEALIHINNQLHQHERWDDALKAYTARASQATSPHLVLDATLVSCFNMFAMSFMCYIKDGCDALLHWLVGKNP